MIRTNNEALIGVVSSDRSKKFSEGIAIGSIVHTDEFSHLEPVRYPSGSGFWRLLMAPMVSGSTLAGRIGKILTDFLLHPVANMRVYFTGNWADRTQILLFMQTLDSTLSLSKGLLGLRTRVEKGTAPSAFIPEAQELAKKFGTIIKGKPLVLPTESLFGIPTTAHILGGACMGSGPEEGVIDKDHRVFGYENLFVIDGSAISANPGVNPSLTITALAERAADLIIAQIRIPE
jgi:cholesterol oxidase